MAERRVMTPEEFEQMRAALRDPDRLARLAADALCSDYPDSDAAITHTYLLNDKEEN